MLFGSWPDERTCGTLMSFLSPFLSSWTLNFFGKSMLVKKRGPNCFWPIHSELLRCDSGDSDVLPLGVFVLLSIGCHPFWF